MNKYLSRGYISVHFGHLLSARSWAGGWRYINSQTQSLMPKTRVHTSGRPPGNRIFQIWMEHIAAGLWASTGRTLRQIIWPILKERLWMRTKSELVWFCFFPSQNYIQVYSEVVWNTHLFGLEGESLAEVKIPELALMLPKGKASASSALVLSLTLPKGRTRHSQGLFPLQQCCSRLMLFWECGSSFQCKFPHLSAQIEWNP